jgi:RNA polymerase sigma factor (sigma-70 family)
MLHIFDSAAEPAEIHPDVALVERAKAGDSAAFEVLIKQYERQIFRTALHITQNREDAEDITQDVFFKAFQKLDQFQGNSKFSTWLVRIAVNESLMRLRKRKTSKDRLHGPGRRDRRGLHPPRLRRVASQPGAELLPGRARRDPAQDNRRACPQVSEPFSPCATSKTCRRKRQPRRSG